jgi:hypothetical protein
MPWENIENRLAKAFSVQTSSADGIISYPSGRLDTDAWLTSAAETDEELRELNIPRMRFLNNRWPIEMLMQLEWETVSSFTRRSVWAMYVNQRVYILFSGGFKYWLVAAIEPRTASVLYREVIGKLLRDPDLIPSPPSHIRYVRPDRISKFNENVHDRSRSSDVPPEKQSYLSKLFVGWIGPWINSPVLGYWHSDDVSIDEKPIPREGQEPTRDRKAVSAR